MPRPGAQARAGKEAPDRWHVRFSMRPARRQDARQSRARRGLPVGPTTRPRRVRAFQRHTLAILYGDQDCRSRMPLGGIRAGRSKPHRAVRQQRCARPRYYQPPITCRSNAAGLALPGRTCGDLGAQKDRARVRSAASTPRSTQNTLDASSRALPSRILRAEDIDTLTRSNSRCACTHVRRDAGAAHAVHGLGFRPGSSSAESLLLR